MERDAARGDGAGVALYGVPAQSQLAGDRPDTVAPVRAGRARRRAARGPGRGSGGRCGPGDAPTPDPPARAARIMSPLICIAEDITVTSPQLAAPHRQRDNSDQRRQGGESWQIRHGVRVDENRVW